VPSALREPPLYEPHQRRPGHRGGRPHPWAHLLTGRIPFTGRNRDDHERGAAGWRGADQARPQARCSSVRRTGPAARIASAAESGIWGGMPRGGPCRGSCVTEIPRQHPLSCALLHEGHATWARRLQTARETRPAPRSAPDRNACGADAAPAPRLMGGRPRQRSRARCAIRGR
jgi:hypothetical protein